MANTIAEFFLQKWISENIPGVKIKIEGRCAHLKDRNGDTMTIMYDSESRRILCADGNQDNL